MRILVTGHKGKIGKVVVDHLTDHKVQGYDIVDGHSINDKEMLRYVFYWFKPEAVIHLAAIPHPIYDDPTSIKKFFYSNVEGTYNVLSISAEIGLKRFIYMSSTGYYGLVKTSRLINPVLPIDELSPSHREASSGPLDSYCISKVIGEDMCAYYGTNGTIGSMTVLRSAPAHTREEAFGKDFDWRKLDKESYQWNTLLTINPPINSAKAIKLLLEQKQPKGYHVYNLANRYAPISGIDMMHFIQDRLGGEYNNFRLGYLPDIYDGESLICTKKIRSIGFVAEDEQERRSSDD